jgi:hypothetical protein
MITAKHINPQHPLSLQSEVQLLDTFLILLGIEIGSEGNNVGNDAFAIVVQFLVYRDSSVCIATSYWLDDSDSISGRV